MPGGKPKFRSDFARWKTRTLFWSHPGFLQGPSDRTVGGGAHPHVGAPPHGNGRPRRAKTTLEIKAKREFKDRVFKDLFGAEERKAYALDLYNALAGTDYGDPGELRLTTLDDALYVTMKNDVSFLIGEEMVLLEHQSTKNPNMPLRGLKYFGKLYAKLTRTEGIDEHSKKRASLPTPRFVVLYNGQDAMPEGGVLRLSDSYEGEGDVEVVAHVVDINAGSGEPALDRCEPLDGYATLVARMREFSRTMEFSEAVDAAVEWCIRHGYLVDYLTARRAEVRDMFIAEYDEERLKEQFREQGREEGREQGREENLLSNIRNLMENTGWDAERAMEALGVPQEGRTEYLELLEH